MTHLERMRKLAEVIKRGHTREGEQTMLLLLLRSRFGDLPLAVENQVREAKEAQLHLWAERILRARSLDQVFRAPSVSVRKAAISRA